MPYDPRWAMWMRACEMLERADQRRREFFRVGDARGAQPQWAPPVDVLETGEMVRIVAALPGVSADDVEVIFKDGSVFIRGRRPWPRDLPTARIYRLEIPHGSFEREVALPPGHYQLAESRLSDGCLLVELRKLSP